MVDSNEFYHGNTWTFPGFSVSTKSLVEYGCDYSIRGLVGTVGVERKSYSDYIRCVGADWKRFQKQLAKLRRNKYHCVIVEGSLDDPINSYSRMVHEAVILRTAQIAITRMPIIFASTRLKATSMCVNFMQAAIKKIRDSQ